MLAAHALSGVVLNPEPVAGFLLINEKNSPTEPYPKK
jgi:hypothetical protein